MGPRVGGVGEWVLLVHLWLYLFAAATAQFVLSGQERLNLAHKIENVTLKCTL